MSQDSHDPIDWANGIDADSIDYDPAPVIEPPAWDEDPAYLATQAAKDAEFDALAAWEAKHEGQDIVQPLDEWMADLAAGRDYVSQWEDAYGPIRAAADDRADYADY